MEDWQLLRDYAERGSEAAFEGLVKRHVDMVHAAALRQLGDADLAKDATQAVFILLARKAKSLRPSVVLSGWLYRTTSHVASRALRDRIRQRRREEEAATMNLIEPAEEEWAKLAPHLDGAISALGATDRDAVVLRFLQQRSFREVAGALGVSEDAAKKRVARALEKLREHLTSRGIAVSSVFLGTALGAQSLSAAPAAVVMAASSAGAQTATTTAAAVSLAGQIARHWFWSRVKWTAALGGVAALTLWIAMKTEFSPTGSVAAPPVAEVSTDNVPAPVAQSEPAEVAAVVPPVDPLRLILQVVSVRNNSPLTGATVRISFRGYRWSDSIKAEAVTGANGIAEITRPDRKFWGMAFWVTAPHHVPQCLSWKPEEELTLPKEYVVRLAPGVPAFGRVMNEEGQLVASASLRFNPEGIQSYKRDYADYRYPPTEVIANEQGQWACDFLDAVEKISGFVTHPDYAETEFSLSTAMGGAKDVAIIIKRGAPVAGLVRTAEGLPVSQASVTLDWQFSWRQELKAVTDVDGRFHFPRVTPSQIRITASNNKFPTVEKWFQLPSEGLNAVIAMSPGKVAGSATLRGRVIDETGKPAARVGVRLRKDQTELEGVEWSAITDEQGRFAWRQAPEGPVGLTVHSSGYEMLDVQLASGDEEHTIKVKAVEAPLLHCRVTDKMSGLAIERFKVLRGARSINYRIPRDQVEFVGDGAKGAFVFPWQRPVLRTNMFETVIAVLRVEADGYEPETVPVTENSDGNFEVRVELEPVGDLKGVVLTPDGASAGGAELALIGGRLHAELRTPLHFSPELSGRDKHFTTVASDGSFRLAARKEGTQMIAVHESGWARVLIEDFGGKIILQRWGRVEGVLRIGSDPGANEKVNVISKTEPDPILTFSSDGTTDDEGRFEFNHVLPGPVRVGRWLMRDSSSVLGNGKAIEVQADETTQVRIGGSGVQMKGRLVLDKPQDGVAWDRTSQGF